MTHRLYASASISNLITPGRTHKFNNFRVNDHSRFPTAENGVPSDVKEQSSIMLLSGVEMQCGNVSTASHGRLSRHTVNMQKLPMVVIYAKHDESISFEHKRCILCIHEVNLAVI